MWNDLGIDAASLEYADFNISHMGRAGFSERSTLPVQVLWCEQLTAASMDDFVGFGHLLAAHVQ